ncbi:MAG: hypothetical protein WEC36_02615 [Phycisphaeraceae bacterium]
MRPHYAVKLSVLSACDSSRWRRYATTFTGNTCGKLFRSFHQLTLHQFPSLTGTGFGHLHRLAQSRVIDGINQLIHRWRTAMDFRKVGRRLLHTTSRIAKCLARTLDSGRHTAQRRSSWARDALNDPGAKRNRSTDDRTCYGTSS